MKYSTAPRLKDITATDVLEYITHMQLNQDPPCSHEQATLIGETFMSTQDGEKMLNALLSIGQSINHETAIMTAFVGGFYHGREFEVRMMAKAMREAK